MQEGYDLGGVDLEALDGEAIVSALRQAAEGLRVARGPAGMRDLEAGLPAGVSISAAEVPPSELKRMLEFPADWGPSEWGERDAAGQQSAPSFASPSPAQPRAGPGC